MAESAKKEQIEIAERLQQKWLQRMERLLDTGEITSTDLATLARVLMSNGWTLDPSLLPASLRTKLQTDVEFDFDDPAAPPKLKAI